MHIPPWNVIRFVLPGPRSGRAPEKIFLGGSGDGAGPREVLRWTLGYAGEQSKYYP
jgi:hypothetical protein